MKKLYTIFLAAVSLSGVNAYSQCSVVVTGQTDVTCFGACDGSVQLTTVGTPTYVYSWAPGGQTVQNPNDLCAGTHTVTMTDANSCVATATVTITEPSELVTAPSTTHVTCFGNCDGSAQSNPSGGTFPYTESWQPGGPNNMCPGTYTVTVTDFNGCTATNTVTITEPAQLSVSSTSTNASCPTCSDGTATATVSGGTGPYSYDWSPGTQNSPTATGLTPGSYTICVTDNNNCTMCDTVVVGFVTGVATQDGLYGISIYPSPATDNINLVVTTPGPADMRVTLYDLTGKAILTDESAANKGTTRSYSLAGYAPGIYMVQVEINGSRMTQKVIKQ